MHDKGSTTTAKKDSTTNQNSAATYQKPESISRSKKLRGSTTNQESHHKEEEPTSDQASPTKESKEAQLLVKIHKRPTTARGPSTESQVSGSYGRARGKEGCWKVVAAATNSGQEAVTNPFTVKITTHSSKDTCGREEAKAQVEVVTVTPDPCVASGDQIHHHHQDWQIAQPFFQDRRHLSRPFVHAPKPDPSAATGGKADPRAADDGGLDGEQERPAAADAIPPKLVATKLLDMTVSVAAFGEVSMVEPMATLASDGPCAPADETPSTIEMQIGRLTVAIAARLSVVKATTLPLKVATAVVMQLTVLSIGSCVKSKEKDAGALGLKNAVKGKLQAIRATTHTKGWVSC